MIGGVESIINEDGEAGEADVWATEACLSDQQEEEGFYVVVPFKAMSYLRTTEDSRFLMRL